MPLSHAPRPAALRPHVATFLAALMLLATPVSHADAQKPRSTDKASIVQWMPGDASHNGYESVSGWFDYYLAPCVGSSITAQLSLRPEVTAAPIYWYRGKRHPLTSDQAQMFSDVSPTRVDMMTTVNATQSKKMMAFEPSTVECSGWTPVANQRDYYPAKATRQEIEDALNRITIGNGTSLQPLRNPRLEQLFDQEVAQARRDSMNRMNDARIDSTNRARVAQARQDSLARARTAGAAGAPGAAGTSGTAGASTRPSSSGRQGSSATTPAQTQAQRQAAAQARADSVQRMLEQQRAENEARDAATLSTVTTAVTTGAALAQGMGAAFGGYYLMGEEPPSNSTSYAVQTLSGIGGGISGRWMYVDAGMISMTLTDAYIAKMKAKNSYAPDKEQSGYFMSGGLSLEMPFDGQSWFAFAPSLGYTYIGTTEEIEQGGVHAGFGVRLGDLKFRVDMGSGNYGATYGFGGYIKF